MSALASSHDSLFVLRNLVEKDFKVRYRNMSLGIFWSLVNPLIMMGVLTFVFTVIIPSNKPNFWLFVLMGILPYNFFTLAWGSGTNSIVDNAGLIKKVCFQRELVPISVVLGNVVHYLIQFGLLLVASALVMGVNLNWLWIPVVIALQLVFVCGVSLLTSSLDVYYRDMRYVVESANLVLFWLLPIFYGFEDVRADYAWIYELNPVAAVILTTRRILLYGQGPGFTIWKLAAVSAITLILGAVVFKRIKQDFSDYL
jgi:ABC-type polysaccharide/polyol phosphate export permease